MFTAKEDIKKEIGKTRIVRSRRSVEKRDEKQNDVRFDRSKKLGEKEKEEQEEIPISRDIFLLDARLQTLS
jgi:hypothetical protein